MVVLQVTLFHVFMLFYCCKSCLIKKTDEEEDEVRGLK